MNRVVVCEVLPRLLIGGAESVVKDYIMNLDDCMFDKHLICVWGKCYSSNECIVEKSKVDTVYLADSIILSSCNIEPLNRIYRHFRIEKELYSYLCGLHPDVVHLHLMGYRMVKTVLEYCNMSGATCVYTVHSNPRIACFGSISRNRLRQLIKRNSQIVITALDTKQEGELKRIFPNNRIIQINNPVDLKLFAPSNQFRIDVRRELGIPESAFVLGHVGRFVSSKNHEFILSIFVEVLKHEENSYLVLVGDGELKPLITNKIIEKGISDRVRFLSNRSDVFRVLNAMDCFVFPSLYEGFPVSLIEAQSVGLKCVISDSISEDCVLSSKVIRISLHCDATLWAKNILYLTDYAKQKNCIEDYDTTNVIIRLQEVYKNA